MLHTGAPGSVGTMALEQGTEEPVTREKGSWNSEQAEGISMMGVF